MKTKPTVPTIASPESSISMHLMCGWPLVLIAIGGAIGGGLGGAAYGINLQVYKSKMPIAVKVILNLVVGTVAIAIWAALAMAIQHAKA